MKREDWEAGPIIRFIRRVPYMFEPKVFSLRDCGDEKDPAWQEDAHIVAPPFFGVMDATSGLYHPNDGPKLFEGFVSGGQMIWRVAQEFAGNYAKQIQPGGEKREHLRRFLECMNVAIMDWRQSAHLLPNPADVPGAAFLFVWIGGRYVHLVQGSDCFAVWEFRDGERCAISHPQFDYGQWMEREIAHLMEKHGGDRSRIWNELLPIQHDYRNRFANVPGGFVHLNGDSWMMKLIRFERIDRQFGLKRLIICTDGFVPFSVSGESKQLAEYILDHYHRGGKDRGGLQAVLRATRKAQRAQAKTSHITLPEATAMAFEF